jgi:hypothetical protein
MDIPPPSPQACSGTVGEALTGPLSRGGGASCLFHQPQFLPLAQQQKLGVGVWVWQGGLVA